MAFVFYYISDEISVLFCCIKRYLLYLQKGVEYHPIKAGFYRYFIEAKL
jgi:hypothetical protein